MDYGYCLSFKYFGVRVCGFNWFSLGLANNASTGRSLLFLTAGTGSAGSVSTVGNTVSIRSTKSTHCSQYTRRLKYGCSCANCWLA